MGIIVRFRAFTCICNDCQLRQNVSAGDMARAARPRCKGCGGSLETVAKIAKKVPQRHRKPKRKR